MASTMNIPAPRRSASPQTVHLFVSTVLLAQAAFFLAIYWARVQTFIVSPGRFQFFQTSLGADGFLFGVPWSFGAASVFLILFLKRERPPILKNLISSTLLALGSLFLAFIVAINAWGT